MKQRYLSFGPVANTKLGILGIYGISQGMHVVNKPMCRWDKFMIHYYNTLNIK